MDLASVYEVELESALTLEPVLSFGALVVWYLCLDWKTQPFEMRPFIQRERHVRRCNKVRERIGVWPLIP